MNLDPYQGINVLSKNIDVGRWHVFLSPVSHFAIVMLRIGESPGCVVLHRVDKGVS